MNVAIILSGGVGKRFGAKVPKQYLDLCGKPVIEYVVDSALKSEFADEIVIVMNEDYIDYVKERNNPKIHFVKNGKERIDSVKNGLNYIKENFPECEKITMLQAVSPFITSEHIDSYFKLLDDYDVVTTAEKCPGELFNINNYEKIDRNEYYFCQSPEAFWFRDLLQNIDENSKYTELIYHYPGTPKVCYYLDFKYNVKLTYESDLKYSEFLMQQKDNRKL